MSLRLTLVALTLAGVTNYVNAQGDPLVFAINEGITYRINPGATADRLSTHGATMNIT